MSETETVEKVSRKSSRVLTFDVVDDLPENDARKGSSGWRGTFDKLVAAYESGELPVDDDGVSKWVVIAKYGNKTGATTAKKSIVKRQTAALTDASIERAIPEGWRVELEVRRPASGGSILAARTWSADLQ